MELESISRRQLRRCLQHEAVCMSTVHTPRVRLAMSTVWPLDCVPAQATVISWSCLTHGDSFRCCCHCVQHEPVHPVLSSPSPPDALDRPCQCMSWPPDCLTQSYRGAVISHGGSFRCCCRYLLPAARSYPSGVKSTIPKSTIPTPHA